MTSYDQTMLGPYSLELLEGRDRAVVDEHLDHCAACRGELAELAELRDLLDTVPPEAFLEGEPDGGDLLVARAVRRVRAERGRGSLFRGPRAVAAAAVLVVVLGVGGYVGSVIGAPSPSSGSAVAVSAGRTVSGADPATGVRLSAVLTAEPGWINVSARFIGVRPGTPCKLVAVSSHGVEQTVLSWVAPSAQPASGVSISGAAVIAPADVAALKVVTFSGRQLVSVPTT